MQFRSNCGINNKEAIRLKSILQKLNVITLFKPLANSFSGMAIKTSYNDIDERFMLINSNQSIGKQHFTICHELYHLFIQKNFSSRICRTGLFNKKNDIQEFYADIFSSYLLLPTDGLIELIPNEELSNRNKISLSTIIYLEQFFSSSRKALLYRLKKMKLINDELYEHYALNVKRSALENGFDTTLYEKGNFNSIIGNYGTNAKELYDNNLISESHYYSLLSDLGIDFTSLDSISIDEE